MSEAIERGELPGAVVLVGRRDAVVLRKAYGSRALRPENEPMTADTIFDIASLTKAVATAPSVMILVEEGRLRLSDPAARYLPEMAPEGGDRAKITVEQLLVHRAGFPPDDPLELYTGSPEEIFARKARQPLASAPGSVFVYSDVGYELLGELVHRVSGQPLDRFAKERIFRPLGMKDTRFLPLSAPSHALTPTLSRGEREEPPPASRIAPTEQRDGQWMRGQVHDPRARALGGVAGHAGLFSTADDLARFCRMILGGGRLGKARILAPLGVEALTRPRFYGDSDVRALGFDIATGFSRNRGELFPEGSFGLTGFTGTSLWIDPSSQTYVVFLSNRVHPDGTGDVGRLRGLVASVAAAAIGDDTRESARRLERSIPRTREVFAGVDVLEADGFRPIAGKRIGLLTNATGRSRSGRSTAEVLLSPEARKAGVSLLRFFSPEHGIRSKEDGAVESHQDPQTGLPVVSLYGKKVRPSPEDLAGLDAVVYDVQDVGTRFYTYVTTLGYLLEETAKARLPLVILDRPDPLGGAAVEGPLADPDRLSFTAYAPIPIRYGLTAGELARFWNADRGIGADLTVVPLRGWSRELWYDQTGLEWVNPSPNMRSLAAAALYPGIALLETTNVSVGRGTDTPFEVLGAPWLDGVRLARVLAARGIAGVTFTPIRFTPSSSTLAGQPCGGLRLTITDREALRPIALGIEIAAALRSLYPSDWDRSRFNALLANAKAFGLLENGATADRIVASWEAEVAAFRTRSEKFRLYR